MLVNVSEVIIVRFCANIVFVLLISIEISCFVLMLVNVNSYGHVGTVTSDCVELLSDIEMNDIPSPVLKYRPRKTLWLICRNGPICHLSWAGAGHLCG